MNRFCPLWLSFFLAAGAVSPAAAQITMTAADVSARFAPGAVVESRIDSTVKTADIGAPGASSWDFSGLKTSIVQTSTSVLPDTTPFIGYFPGSTHVLRQTSSGITSYSYFRLATDLSYLGIASSGAYQMRMVFEPGSLLYRLPMTMGTQWTTTYAESLVVVLPPPAPPQVTVTNSTVTNTVDAYGTLTLPGGGTYQALRVKTDSRSVSGGRSTRLVSYSIVARNFASVGVTAADTLQPESGTIAASSVSWTAPRVTDVPPGDAFPAGFALGRNYPNPFGAATTIRFDLPQPAFVNLVVVDVLGKEAAVLVRRQLPAGTYRETFDATGLPEGVYFYRLQTPAGSIARKMLLLR